MCRCPVQAMSYCLTRVLYATLLILLPTLTWAQTGRMTGRVVAQDTEQPLPGSNLMLIGGQDTLVAICDAQGRFNFSHLPTGLYTLKITFVGYHPTEVVDVEITDAQLVERDFQLAASAYAGREMVVSASRRAENIIDAPASVSKVDAREIQANTASVSYGGMIKHTKGIDHFQTGVLQERINARGFNSAFNYRMLFLVDGRVTLNPSIGLTLPSAPIPKDDLQSIEVIVGPGSAIYGPDATSGVVNITSQDPKTSPRTSVSFSGGNRSTMKSRIHHANFNNKWAWKLSGHYQRAVDYQVTNVFYNADSSRSVTDDPDFDANMTQASAGLFYYPNETSRFAFNTGIQLVKGLSISSLGRTQLDNQYTFQQLTFKSSNWFVNLYHTRDNLGETHGLEAKAAGFLAGLSEADAIEGARFKGHSSLWEAEARYTNHMPTFKTRFSLGTNFRQFRPDTEGTLLNDATQKIVINQSGVYGQTETDFTEQLRLVLAARLDKHEAFGAQVSPKIGLIVKPRPTLAFRATFNRAFQSPSLGNQHLLVRVNPVVVARGNGGYTFVNTTGAPLPADFQSGIDPIQPEENTAFELGFKGVLSTRVFLDISGYRSQYKNFISPLTPINDLANGIVVLDENGNPRAGEVTLTYLNFGKQIVYGIDAGAQVYASDRVVLKGNISYIHPGDLIDAGRFNQPFNTPEYLINLGLSARDVLTQGMNLDFALRHVVEHEFRSGVHVGTVPAYTVVDLHLGYKTQVGMTYKLSVPNVLDNKHREFVTGPKIGRMVVGELQYGF